MVRLDDSYLRNIERRIIDDTHLEAHRMVANLLKKGVYDIFWIQ